MQTSTEFGPGDGPARKVSVSIPAGDIAAVRARGTRGFSAYVTEAVERRIQRERHEYAIDSVVAATALDYTGPRIVVTSDTNDMNELCGDRVRAVGV